ncbi:MAG: serine/threonine protein kinase [Verrucomicrobia bacterium]|nr:MAG: serine/threonine protein kinase [Verrucomicrobiota bacterium]
MPVMAPLFTIQDGFTYEVTRKIAEGGMGIVYEAAQLGARGFRKRVALKTIRERFARQKMFMDNFIGEAKLVADLIHTNIVQTYHLGEADGLCFITMEYINGVNLEQFRRQLESKGRQLPKEMAVFIASRIARGLAYAHAKRGPDGKPLGIVHRDVNPKNVMIAFEGDVKLTDFGVAKARGYLTDREGEVAVGKPAYMSPEQADFRVTDKRSDLFSTGVVLLELLLGHNPFRGGSSEESRRNVIEKPLPPFQAMDPRIDDDLARILAKALERDPLRRYQSADDLRDDLEWNIYHKGLGPTNETLGRYMRELFGQIPPEAINGARGSTKLLENTARTRAGRRGRGSRGLSAA